VGEGNLCESARDHKRAKQGSELKGNNSERNNSESVTRSMKSEREQN
jgi:hypothetical protein